MAKHAREIAGRHEARREQPSVITVAKVGAKDAASEGKPARDAADADGLPLSDEELGEMFDEVFDEDVFADDAADDGFAFAHDAELWPEMDVVPDDAAFARHYSDRDAPKRGARRRLTLKGFLKGAGKVLLFLLVSALAATVLGAVVYMLGTHTPIADMPGELVVFFRHLFA